jgi:nitrogen regulatory protein P-II 2
MANVNFKLVTMISEPVLSNSLVITIRSLGATGFTMTDVRGEGSGEKRSGEVPNEKVKIEVVADADLAKKIMAEIAENYFANYSLIVYSSDIQVIRHEKF